MTTPLSKLMSKFQTTPEINRAVVICETVSTLSKEWKTLLSKIEKFHGDVFIIVKEDVNPLLKLDQCVSILEQYTAHAIFSTTNFEESIDLLEGEGYNHITVLGEALNPRPNMYHIPTTLKQQESRVVEFLKEDSPHFVNECFSPQTANLLKEAVSKQGPSLREQYLNGDIFNIGSLVESNNKIFQILDKGPNYVRAVDSDGEVKRLWVKDIKQTKNPQKHIPVSEHQLSFFGYTTSKLSKKQKQLFESLLTEDDVFAVFSAIKHTDQFYKATGLVEMHNHFTQAGRFLDKLGVTQIHTYRDDMENALAEAAVSNIPDIAKITKNDKVKTADIIGAACGLKSVTGTPEEIVNKAAKAIVKDRPDTDVLPIYGSMFELADTVGIQWDKTIFSDEQLRLMGLLNIVDESRILQFCDEVAKLYTSFSSIVESYDVSQLVVLESNGNLIPLDDIEGDDVVSKVAAAVKTKVGQPTRTIQVAEPSTPKDYTRRAKNLMLKYLKARREKTLFTDKEKAQLESILKGKGSVITAGSKKLIKKLQQIEAERLITHQPEPEAQPQ